MLCTFRFTLTRHLIVLQQIIQRCGFPDEVPDGTTERIHSTFLPHYVVLNLSYYILSWITETNATAPPSDSLEQGLRQMAVLKISRQNTGTQHAAQIGNGSTLIDFMTVLYTRWRFDNYTKGEFLHCKKWWKKFVNFNFGKIIIEKFVKLCLHLSYTVCRTTFNLTRFQQFQLWLLWSSANFRFYWN